MKTSAELAEAKNVITVLSRAGFLERSDLALAALAKTEFGAPSYASILNVLYNLRLTTNLIQCDGELFDEPGTYAWLMEQVVKWSEGAIPISGIQQTLQGQHPFMEITLSFLLDGTAYRWEISAGWVDTSVLKKYAGLFRRYVKDMVFAYCCYPPVGSNACYFARCRPDQFEIIQNLPGLEFKADALDP